jgi:hypothetical protein
MEAFNNLTSLTATLQTDTSSGFASPVQLTVASLPLASLTVGAKFPITHVPESPSGNDITYSKTRLLSSFIFGLFSRTSAVTTTP